MLHSEFQGDLPFGSEEGFLRFLWAWQLSWSCDLDHLNKLSFPHPRRLHMKVDFDWPSGFLGKDV